MGEATIVATARTPIGSAFKGSLLDVDPYDLAIHAVSSAVERAGLPVELYDDVILGESRYGGGDIARYAAIEAGLVDVAGLAHNRHCAVRASPRCTTAAADHPRRHGPGRRRRRRRVDAPPSPRFTRRVPGTDDVGRLVAAEPPSRRPTRRTWTCRSPSAGTPRSRPT